MDRDFKFSPPLFTSTTAAINPTDQVIGIKRALRERAIESREDVIKRARSTEVLSIDSDNSDDEYHTPPPSKRSKHSRSRSGNIVGEVIEKITVPSSMDDFEDNALLADKPAPKRKLFQSGAALGQMYEFSGLPSPPDSDNKSLNGSQDKTAGEASLDFVFGNWSWDQVNGSTDNALLDGEVEASQQNDGVDIPQEDVIVKPPARNIFDEELGDDLFGEQQIDVDQSAVDRSEQLRQEKRAARSSKSRASSNGILNGDLPQEEKRDKRPTTTTHSTTSTLKATKTTSTDFDRDAANAWDMLDDAVHGDRYAIPDTSRAANRTAIPPSSRPSPLSRNTANTFRTQNRHLGDPHDSGTEDATEPVSLDAEAEQQRREGRLRRIQMNSNLAFKPAKPPKPV
ncbi:hypothetical protein LTR66_016346, partial [Elasticomyces elasticus]